MHINEDVLSFFLMKMLSLLMKFHVAKDNQSVHNWNFEQTWIKFWISLRICMIFKGSETRR